MVCLPQAAAFHILHGQEQRHRCKCKVVTDGSQTENTQSEFFIAGGDGQCAQHLGDDRDIHRTGEGVEHDQHKHQAKGCDSCRHLVIGHGGGKGANGDHCHAEDEVANVGRGHSSQIGVAKTDENTHINQSDQHAADHDKQGGKIFAQNDVGNGQTVDTSVTPGTEYTPTEEERQAAEDAFANW